VDEANDPTDRLLISVREAANRLGIGRDATYGLVRDGKLPSIRVGRRVLVPARLLASWVDRETQSSGTRG